MGKNGNNDTVKRLKKETGYVPIGFKVLGGFFGFLFVVISLIVPILCFAYYEIAPTINDFWRSSYDDVRKSTTETFREEENSFIYDVDGNCIAKLRSEKNTTYLDYEDIPDDVIDAFISVEDRRFYQHKGVDLKSVLKAVYLLYENSGEPERGASTITQQLAKNIYLTNERSYERKLREIFYALGLEEIYTKEEILEFYINNIYFGNNYYGISAAAQGYFSKSVDELSLAEVAFLCSIPNNPTHYDPIENHDNTMLRRDKILDDMLELDYITSKECEKAKKDKCKLKLSNQKFYNYEVSYAIECAVEHLMKKDGFKFRYMFESMNDYQKYRLSYLEDYNDKREQLFRGGYSVYTTISKKEQKILQKAIDDELSFSKKKTDDGTYWLQGAATVIDNNTGKVIAIVGGRTQPAEHRTLNRAFQSFKQPGSSFKPLAVYTPAIESGYTKDTIVSDRYSEDGPRNSGNRYEGDIKLYRAIVKSKNVVAWNVFKQIGIENGLSYVRNMGFSHLVPNDNVLAASLGGLTYGTSTVEMANGYATLYNDGMYRHADCLKSILDHDGNELYVDEYDNQKRIYSEYASRSMTEILEGVLKESYGTGYGLALANGMPCAGKTGTTNDQTNAWFCGYSPYYTISVWVGTDKENNGTIDNLWGATYPGEIWKSVQDQLCEGKKVKEFKKPESAKKKTKKKSKEDVATDNLINDVDKETGSLKEQSALVLEVGNLLEEYNNLNIRDRSSVNKARSLSKKIENKINQIKDTSVRNGYAEQFNSIKSVKNNLIKEFERREESNNTETTTAKPPTTTEAPTTTKKEETTTVATTSTESEATTTATESSESSEVSGVMGED